MTLEEAIEIFSRYPKYIMKDKATSGLYKRELCALQEYMKYNKKSFGIVMFISLPSSITR